MMEIAKFRHAACWAELLLSTKCLRGPSVQCPRNRYHNWHAIYGESATRLKSADTAASATATATATANLFLSSFEVDPIPTFVSFPFLSFFLFLSFFHQHFQNSYPFGWLVALPFSQHQLRWFKKKFFIHYCWVSVPDSGHRLSAGVGRILVWDPFSTGSFPSAPGDSISRSSEKEKTAAAEILLFFEIFRAEWQCDTRQKRVPEGRRACSTGPEPVWVTGVPWMLEQLLQKEVTHYDDHFEWQRPNMAHEFPSPTFSFYLVSIWLLSFFPFCLSFSLSICLFFIMFLFISSLSVIYLFIYLFIFVLYFVARRK